MSEEENKGFKVRDRRIHAEGNDEAASDTAEETSSEEAPIEETPSEETSEVADAGDEAPQDDAAPADEPAEDEPVGDMPINFATFLISLGDSAMIHLGAIPHPATGEPARDLRAARQTIDIIGILDEKTKGNLDENEQKLMSNLLYALRMQFVQAGKS